MYRIFFGFIICVLVASCNSHSSNLELSGKWSVVEFTPNTNLDISPEIMEGGREIAMSQVYNFDDSLCIINNSFLQSSDTSYFLYTPEDNILTFKNDATGMSSEYEVESISEDKLKWTMSMGEGMGSIILIIEKQ